MAISRALLGFGIGVALLAGLSDAYAQLPSGTVSRTEAAIGGRERSYVLYAPRNLQPGAPLVFVLHGSGGDGPSMRQYTDYAFDLLADRHGFAVIYPSGFEDTWNDCRKGSPFSSKRLGIDDVGFVTAMIDRAVASHGIDRKRVFAAGHSNGGQLAYRLALENPSAFAGVAAISANLPVDENLDCRKSNAAMPVMIVNGTRDPINPYGGGMVRLGFTSLGNVLSTEANAAYWARLSGIGSAPETVRLPHRPQAGPTAVMKRTWLSGGKPAIVVYSVEGGGHEIPMDGDLHTPTAVWDFFSQLPSR